MPIFKNLKDQKWIQALAKFAPTVAAALGGPLAGTAIGMIADALGVEPNEDEISAKIIAGNPDTFLCVENYYQEFRKQVPELAVPVVLVGIKQDQEMITTA